MIYKYILAKIKMTKKIKCQQKSGFNPMSLRVRVVKAPLVNNNDLRNVLVARAKALVV